jgi:DNA-binding protein YbaB
MFDAFKQMKQLYEMQKKLGDIVVEETSSNGNVSIRINGKMEVLQLSINNQSEPTLSDTVLQTINSAIRSVHLRISEDMRNNPGADLPTSS